MEGEEQKVGQAVDEPKKGKLWLVVLVLVIIVAGAGGYFVFAGKSGVGKSSGGSSADPSKMIQADFIDLSKIYSISKFRSGSGHDFSKGSGESCRSMKHYFNPQETTEKWRALEANQGMPPAPDGSSNDIAIYSPVDGKITGIAKEQTPIGEQVYITPDNAKDYTVRLFHVYLDDGIGKGSVVKAGQKIGDISQYSSTDIAINKGNKLSQQYISYFDVMPDEIFAKYAERGIKTRDDLILTKEYRDANPLQCNGEQFATNYDQDPNSGNLVRLSGYSADGQGPATTGTPTESSSSSTQNTDSGSNSNAGSGGGSGTGGGGGGGRR